MGESEDAMHWEMNGLLIRLDIVLETDGKIIVVLPFIVCLCNRYYRQQTVIVH